MVHEENIVLCIFGDNLLFGGCAMPGFHTFEIQHILAEFRQQISESARVAGENSRIVETAG